MIITNEEVPDAQRVGEDYRDTHERLRPYAVSNITEVFLPLTGQFAVHQRSDYTMDISRIVGIENAGAVCTGSCKHSPPYDIYVGIKGDKWAQRDPAHPNEFVFDILPLPRRLTVPEKNAIYDRI